MLVCVLCVQWGIRKETTNNVARLYRQLMSGSFSSGGAGPASTSPAHHPDLDWMPNKILHCYYLPSNEHRSPLLSETVAALSCNKSVQQTCAYSKYVRIVNRQSELAYVKIIETVTCIQ